MFQIEGVLNLLPESVATTGGEIKDGDENPRPAIVHTVVTGSGAVRIIYPLENVDMIIDQFRAAKQMLEDQENSGLYIPKSQSEIDEVAKLQETISGRD